MLVYIIVDVFFDIIIYVSVNIIDVLYILLFDVFVDVIDVFVDVIDVFVDLILDFFADIINECFLMILLLMSLLM